MTSTRPYLLRALYEWIVDNGLTPHVLVDAKVELVEVPQQYIEDDKIVLNITPNAIRDLDIGNETLRFSARFAGKSQHITVPITAVLAIYARENGKGMLFPEEEAKADISADMPEPDHSRPLKKPHLKIIK